MFRSPPTSFRGLVTSLVLVWVLVPAREAAAQHPRPFSVPPPPMAPSQPESFGPTDSYVTLGEWEFTPALSAWTFGDTGGNQPLKYSTTGNAFFHASPHIPSGALLTYLEFDYCDDNATEDIAVQLVNTTYLNVAINQLAAVSSSGAPGCTFGNFDISPFDFHVDNVFQRLVLQASFGNNADSTTRFAGVIIGYRLQVSPAPGAATFNDVPTTHPFFQFIEALSASGITGGCGGGNYCPDAPVTRGQMAVFLSKALGLYWRY
jgi:hypothetical protein